MAGQLIPPPGQEPSVDPNAPFEQKLEAWIDLMNTCEHLLRSGLRRRIGEQGDEEEAFRQWYERDAQWREREKIERMRMINQRRANRA